jgi:O-antigen/teichoic acid export membrane protein
LLNLNFTAPRRVAQRLLLLLFDRIQHSAEGLRLARGMAWSLVGAVSSRGLALVASVIAARVLGKSVFGELGIIQSTINMYGTFAQLGGLTATKHVAEFRKRAPERAGRIIALSIVAAVASGAVAGTFMVVTSSWAARLLAAPRLQGAIATSALALLLIVTNEAQDGVLSGLEAFKRRSVVQFTMGIASFPLVVLGVFFFGLVGAVWGLIASQGLLALLNYRAICKETSLAGVPIRWREVAREIRILATFGLPTLCSGAVYVPSMWIANMILVNTAGGYAEMGIFNAADRWRTAILFFPLLLGGVTLPMLASLRGEFAIRRYHKLLWANIKLSVFASLAVAAPVAFFARWIMTGFGPGFAEGTWVLITLCTTSVAFAAYWIVGQSLVSQGHVWTMFSFNLGWAVTLLTSEWLLRAHGAKGLAGAYLFADVARLIAALIYANRMLLIDGYALADPRGGVSQQAIVQNVGNERAMQSVDVGPC